MLTSLGTAACGAVVLSWPARSTWPAPPAIGRATEQQRNKTQKVHTDFQHEQEKKKRYTDCELGLNLQCWAIRSLKHTLIF